MKKITLFILSGLSAATLTAHATSLSLPFSMTKHTSSSINACDDQTQSAHCAYSNFDVPPDNLTTGKSIKFTMSKASFSMTVCMTKEFSMSLDNEAIEKGINAGFFILNGENEIQYEQCKDVSCTETNGLTQIDRFQINQTGEHTYTTNPKTFAIHIDHNYGSDCQLKLPN